MSISPAQFAMVLGPVAEAERPAGTPLAQPSQVAEAPPELPVEPSESSTPDLSTEMRVDDQRRIYYAVVNNRTGDEICEIPPEVIRKLGEDLSKLPDGLLTGHAVDVKS